MSNLFNLFYKSESNPFVNCSIKTKKTYYRNNIQPLNASSWTSKPLLTCLDKGFQHIRGCCWKPLILVQKQASGSIMHVVLLEARTESADAHMCLTSVFLISGGNCTTWDHCSASTEVDKRSRPISGGVSHTLVLALSSVLLTVLIGSWFNTTHNLFIKKKNDEGMLLL